MPNKSRLAFATLLKLLSLKDEAAKGQLRRRLEPGGFDFWRPLGTALAAALAPGSDVGAVIASLDVGTSKVQAKHNKRVTRVVYDWAQTEKLTFGALPPPIFVPFGETGLEVKLAPEMAFESDGKICAVCVWGTLRPPLSNEAISIGLQLLADEYGKLGQTFRFAIFNSLTRKLTYFEDRLPNSEALLLAAELSLGGTWGSAKGSAATKPKKQKPIPPHAPI